jgi:hypothetical protein
MSLLYYPSKLLQGFARRQRILLIGPALYFGQFDAVGVCLCQVLIDHYTIDRENKVRIPTDSNKLN